MIDSPFSSPPDNPQLVLTIRITGVFTTSSFLALSGRPVWLTSNPLPEDFPDIIQIPFLVPVAEELAPFVRAQSEGLRTVRRPGRSTEPNEPRVELVVDEDVHRQDMIPNHVVRVQDVDHLPDLFFPLGMQVCHAADLVILEASKPEWEPVLQHAHHSFPVAGYDNARGVWALEGGRRAAGLIHLVPIMPEAQSPAQSLSVNTRSSYFPGKRSSSKKGLTSPPMPDFKWGIFNQFFETELSRTDCTVSG